MRGTYYEERNWMFIVIGRWWRITSYVVEEIFVSLYHCCPRSRSVCHAYCQGPKFNRGGLEYYFVTTQLRCYVTQAS